MAKNKTTVPAEPAEDPTAIASKAKATPITGARIVPRESAVRPKVSPRYAFLCRVGLPNEKVDYEYDMVGVDGADCKAQLVKNQPAFAANLSKLSFNAKRQSWIPTNVEQLTVEQVGKLNGLTDAQKADLVPKAIQPETTEAEVETVEKLVEAA